MYLISYGCSVSVEGPAAFRIAWGVQAIPGIVLGVAMFFFPESPRWLASRTMSHPLFSGNTHQNADTKRLNR